MAVQHYVYNGGMNTMQRLREGFSLWAQRWRVGVSAALLAVGAISIAGAVQAQESSPTPTLGPVVPSYGPVMAVPGKPFNLDPNTQYKVSIDIGASAEFPGDLNPKLVSVARFLNMHPQHGIKADNVSFAAIVHGRAANDLLTDAAHVKRFGEPNPNTALLQELNAAGVTIYLCGQTAAFRGMAADEFNPAVTMAVSAMTSHVRLQQEGYTLIPF